MYKGFGHTHWIIPDGYMPEKSSGGRALRDRGRSDIPVVVQYSRLDATQAENALMSVMAFPVRQGGEANGSEHRAGL